MPELPSYQINPKQLAIIETCLHTVIEQGYPGLSVTAEKLTMTLSQLTAAHVFILHDAPQFVLIIHNHCEKLTILGRIQPTTLKQYGILLDGRPVKDGRTLIRIINEYL